MNSSKRKLLHKADQLMSEAGSIIERVLEKEQFAFDNLPEGIQDCEYGYRFESAIDSMEGALDNIEGAKEKLSLAMI